MVLATLFGAEYDPGNYAGQRTWNCFCRVSDTGRAFRPSQFGHTSPEPARLREGGYGWFLIRSLARALTYQRVGDTNCLTFWVPVDHKLPVAELAD